MTKNQNFSKRKLASVIRGAANRIEKYGFIKNEFGSSKEGYCALGAVRAEASPRHRSDPSQLSYEAGVALREYISKTFGEFSVPGFNDAPETNKQTVVRVMRGCARALEHGFTPGLRF